MLMSGNTVNFGSLTASISPNNPIEASKPGDTAEIPTKLGRSCSPKSQRTMSSWDALQTKLRVETGLLGLLEHI